MTEVDRTGEPLLKFDNVSMCYMLKKGRFKREPFWALKDVSFELYKGESLGVVGTNGSGKSTLLSLMAGIMSPDKGTVVKNTKRISLLALQAGFIAYLSGRENAILGGIFLGVSRKEIQGKVDDIIEFAELGDFADQPFSTYSTGMRARLGFAVAFQIDPDILLIDEVTSVGDARFQEKSFAVMQDKIVSNKSIVFVSHAASQVKKLCDKAIWLNKGEVMASGDIDEVLPKYDDFIKTRAQKK
jgi:lipopolysaccharide transport system ATP-binding protein